MITADSETVGFGVKGNALDGNRQTFWRAENLATEDGAEYQEVVAKTAYDFSNGTNGNEVKIAFAEPVNAQHVKLEFYTNTGDVNYGQVGELEIMGNASAISDSDIAGKNLALNKPVITEDDSYGKATDIVDGDKSTFADFGAKNFPNEVIIDLENIYALDKFEMYLPSASNWGTRTQEIEFRSSVDGKNYTSLVEKANYKFEQETITLHWNWKEIRRQDLS